MSIFADWYIRCSYCSCIMKVTGGRKNLRQEAKTRGWIKTGKSNDCCPACISIVHLSPERDK